MISKIYLHTGLHKTGTTTIQNALAENREILSRMGYLYPRFSDNSFDISNHSVPVYSMFCQEPWNYHINMLRQYTSPESVKMLHERYHHQLTGQIISFRGKNMILSGEDISKLSEAELIRFREFLKSVSGPDVTIEVVTVIRHPLDWFNSLVQQWIKVGAVTLQNFSGTLQMANEYLNVFSRMQRVFGNGHVHFYRFEDLIRHEKGLVAAFVELLNIPDGIDYKLCSAKEAVNVSMSYEGVMIIDHLSRKYPRFVDQRLNHVYEMPLLNALFQIPGAGFQIDKKINRIVWELLNDKINSICVQSGWIPYEYYEKPVVQDDEKWGDETLDYLVAVFPKLKIELRREILNLLLAELNRYHRKFKLNRQLRILARVFNNASGFGSVSRFQKAYYMARQLGFVRYGVLSLFLYLNLCSISESKISEKTNDHSNNNFDTFPG